MLLPPPIPHHSIVAPTLETLSVSTQHTTLFLPVQERHLAAGLRLDNIEQLRNTDPTEDESGVTG